MKFKIFEFDELPSTNSFALENLQNYDDGAVILARSQTHGRGRQQREWSATAGKNLTFSIILKKDYHHIRRNGLMAQSAALAICRALDMQDFADKVYLKWPNDVLINASKVCGILAESKDNCLVIGIGININSDAGELSGFNRQATSLKIEDQQQDYDCREVLSLFLMHFGKLIDTLPSGFESLRQDIQNRIIPRKDIVAKIINDQGEEQVGLLEELDENGALLLQTKEGLKRYDYGEVSLRF